MAERLVPLDAGGGPPATEEDGGSAPAENAIDEPALVRRFLDGLPGRTSLAARLLRLRADSRASSAEPPPPVPAAAKAAGHTYVVEHGDGRSRVLRVPVGSKAEPLAHEPPRATRTPAKRKGAHGPASAPPAPASDRGLARAELPLPADVTVSEVVQVGADLRLRVASPLEEPRWVRYLAAGHRLVEETERSATPERAVTRSSCRTPDGGRVPVVYVRAPLATPAAPLLVVVRFEGAELGSPLRELGRLWLDVEGEVAEVHLPRGAGASAALARCAETLAARRGSRVVLAADGEAAAHAIDVAQASPSALAAVAALESGEGAIVTPNGRPAVVRLGLSGATDPSLDVAAFLTSPAGLVVKAEGRPGGS